MGKARQYDADCLAGRIPKAFLPSGIGPNVIPGAQAQRGARGTREEGEATTRPHETAQLSIPFEEQEME